MGEAEEIDWDNRPVISPPSIEKDPIAHWKWRAEVAQAALDTLAREETAADRAQELLDSGIDVTLLNETGYAVIRDMSDEEFNDYKTKLREEN